MTKLNTIHYLPYPMLENGKIVKKWLNPELSLSQNSIMSGFQSQGAKMVMFQWDARHWETVKQLENSFKGINSHGNVIIFVLADTRQQALTVALVAGAGKSYYECGSNNWDWLHGYGKNLCSLMMGVLKKFSWETKVIKTQIKLQKKTILMQERCLLLSVKVF